MRICDVTQFYSPYGGGVRRYLTEKRRFILEETNDEHVLVVPGEANSLLREGRLTTCTIASPRISATSGYRALLNQKKLRRALREIAPDLIECGDPYQVAWTALAEARTLGVPVVGFYHSHFPDAYLRTAGKYAGRMINRAVFNYARRYVSRLYNQFDSTLVCAIGLRKLLGDWGVNNVRGVKLGIDTDAFSTGPADPAFRAKMGIPASAFLLLYVGRLAGEKNVATLLEAFRLLRHRSAVNYHLLCVGQGPWLEALGEARRQIGVCVHWIQYVARSTQLAEIYRAADLAVHPCLNETFGLVPLEAQACGLPVCGIRGSFLDENIAGGLEFWAAENKPALLADAIERMQRLDLPKLGKTVSPSVRNQYAWPIVLRDLWQSYREILEAGPRNPIGPRTAGASNLKTAMSCGENIFP